MLPPNDLYWRKTLRPNGSCWRGVLSEMTPFGEESSLETTSVAIMCRGYEGISLSPPLLKNSVQN